MNPSFTVYTLGHSTRSTEELLQLLSAVEVRTLVDVRAQPHSRRHPQFNQDLLREALEEAGLVYHWAGRQLGGLRAPRANSPHIGLQEEALRGYADHMDTDVFRQGVTQLINIARRSSTVMMCAERLPEDCHRNLLADYLLLQGIHVIHLIGPHESREHHLHPNARRESGTLIYDRNTVGKLI